MHLQKVLILIVLCLSLPATAQYTETINSNRPGNSQGAFSVGTGVLQLETGVKKGTDTHSLLDTETDLLGIEYALRYGILFPELELILNGSYLSSTINYELKGEPRTYEIQNFSSNTFGVKYLVYDPHRNGDIGREVNLYSWDANQRFDWTQLIPAVSIYAGVNLALEDNPYLYRGEGRFTPKVALISQNNWAGGWVFVVNVIADKIGEEFPSYIGIATLTHSFNARFAAFGEFHGIISDLYSDEIFRAGLAYLFHKNFQADISGLFSFKDTPSRWQIELGISYRLDMHKKDFYLEKQEEELP